jgi:hypothetical protein
LLMPHNSDTTFHDWYRWRRFKPFASGAFSTNNGLRLVGYPDR